jgi:predicted ferric reductase
VYVGLVVLPLALLLVGPVPPGREFLRELSVSLAFAGTAILVLQFALTARFRRIKAPYGIDLVYHFHREISFVALSLLVSHPVMLFIVNPRLLALLNPLTAPWRATFGLIALVTLLAIVLTSVLRKRFRIKYEAWRHLHGILALVAVGLAIAHIEGVGYYVNTPWKRVLWIAYPALWAGLLLYMSVLRPWWLARRPWVVREVRPERGATWTMVLEAQGHSGMSFSPGQFAWLTVDESPFMRREHPFSFSSSATERGRVAFTIKEAGDFTSRIKDVQPGTRVFLDGAYGHFSIDRHKAPAYVFVAGGIGITPLLGTLRTMAERGDQRPVLLIDVNRDWEEITFREELAALEERLHLTVVHVLTRPSPEWTAPSGRFNAAMLLDLLPDDFRERDYFICGPGSLMDMAEKTLYDAGIHFRQVHSERFDLV